MRLGWAFLPAAVSPRRLIVMYIHTSTHHSVNTNGRDLLGAGAPMLNRMYRSYPCSLYLGPGLPCLSVCLSAPRIPLRGQWHTAQPHLGDHEWPGGCPWGPGVTPWDREGLPHLPAFPSTQSTVFTGSPFPLGVDG